MDISGEKTLNVEMTRIVPGFSYGPCSASSQTCPSPSAWDYPILKFTIKNTSDIPIQHTLSLYRQNYSHTYDELYDPFLMTYISKDGKYEYKCQFNLALDPGESHIYQPDFIYTYEGYQYCCSSSRIAKHYTVYFWLEDEDGNKSPIQSIYRS